jgi:hypothetical protein
MFRIGLHSRIGNASRTMNNGYTVDGLTLPIVLAEWITRPAAVAELVANLRAEPINTVWYGHTDSAEWPIVSVVLSPDLAATDCND